MQIVLTYDYKCLIFSRKREVQNFYLAPARVRSLAMIVSVCLFVCPVAYLKNLHVQTLRNFLYMLNVAVSWSCHGGLQEYRVGLDQRSYSTPGPVSTQISECLLAGKPPRFVTSNSGQLSLLASTGRKISTGQSAVTLCGWGVKAGMVHSTCG